MGYAETAEARERRLGYLGANPNQADSSELDEALADVEMR